MNARQRVDNLFDTCFGRDVEKAELSRGVLVQLLLEHEQDVYKQFHKLIRKVEESPEPVVEPIESDDDVYTIADFAEICRNGGFIDDDGFGVYAIDGQKTDIRVDLSSPALAGFTHVVWYNK